MTLLLPRSLALASRLLLLSPCLLLLASCSPSPPLPTASPTSPLQLPTVDLQRPTAMLIEIEGEVMVQQGAGSPSSATGRQLQPHLLPFPLLEGDTVHVAENSSARIICRGDRELLATASKSLTISEALCQSGTPLPTGAFAAVLVWAGQPVPTARGEILQMPVRDHEEDYGYLPVILSPRHTALLDPRPTIRWTAVNGAIAYLVTLSGPEGLVIDSLETTATELPYPTDAPDLQAGVPYFIQVSARTGPADPLRTTDPVSVTLLTEELIEQVNLFTTAIHARPLSETGRHYLLGGYYAGRSLYQMAIAEFEALLETQPTALTHQAVGNLYLHIGLLHNAFPHYDKALALALAAGDPLGQAAAHIGLGQVACGWEHRAEALTHLEAALSLYREQGLAQEAAALEAAINHLSSSP